MISDGSIAIAVLSSSVPGDTRRWVAVEGDNLAATLTIPEVGVTIGNVEIKVNRATGAYTDPVSHATTVAHTIDWSSAIGTGNGDGHASARRRLTGSRSAGPRSPPGDELSVGGVITLLTIGDFVSGSANFNVTEQTVSVDLDGDGNADLIGATLLTVGAHATSTSPSATRPARTSRSPAARSSSPR